MILQCSLSRQEHERDKFYKVVCRPLTFSGWLLIAVGRDRQRSVAQ